MVIVSTGGAYGWDEGVTLPVWERRGRGGQVWPPQPTPYPAVNIFADTVDEWAYSAARATPDEPSDA